MKEGDSWIFLYMGAKRWILIEDHTSYVSQMIKFVLEV